MNHDRSRSPGSHAAALAVANALLQAHQPGKHCAWRAKDAARQPGGHWMSPEVARNLRMVFLETFGGSKTGNGGNPAFTTSHSLSEWANSANILFATIMAVAADMAGGGGGSWGQAAMKRHQ